MKLALTLLSWNRALSVMEMLNKNRKGAEPYRHVHLLHTIAEEETWPHGTISEVSLALDITSSSKSVIFSNFKKNSV